MATERSVAVLTLKDAGEMTAEGRRAIAAWLRQQADDLIEDGSRYATRFRARYIVSGEE